MAELKNEFTWSFSRAQTFATCQRRYWLRYYAFWGGWSRGAPELAQRAYFFSKMATLKMMAGTAVHATLADLLRARAAGRTPTPPYEQLRQRMNDAWVASKQERWRTVGPKQAPPLFEHYFALSIAPSELTALRDHAVACVRHHLDSELARDIERVGPAHWRSIDELEVAPIGCVPCFVAPDFAFDRDGETWLLDWKTGGERNDHAFQLLAYAHFARAKWGLDPTRLRAFDVMLQSGTVIEVPISATALDGAAEKVRASAEAMRERLVDRAANSARIEDFPPTTDVHECRRCFFQQVCEARLGTVADLQPPRQNGESAGT